MQALRIRTLGWLVAVASMNFLVCLPDNVFAQLSTQIDPISSTQLGQRKLELLAVIKKPFDAFEVHYSTALGGPVPQRFVMENIDLAAWGEPGEINHYIASLEVERTDAVSMDIPVELRTWRDASGKFSIPAKFVSRDATSVRLEKPDGSQITVPLAKLSAADVEYIESLRQ